MLLALSGCGTLTKLSEVGGPPGMTPVTDPTRDPAFRPLTMPMPGPQAVNFADNTLWRPGSRAFFKDQRAARVGDLVTVLVNITDNADFTDNTKATRNGSQSSGAPSLFGLETKIPHTFAGANAASLVSTNSAGALNGSGETKRTEVVALRLAGLVTQVLPNGNLVVAARQEVRVNNELRRLSVAGVVRPEDIASDNTVSHDRMAEARISYGGRGQLTDVQQARWGDQLVDILSPF